MPPTAALANFTGWAFLGCFPADEERLATHIDTRDIRRWWLSGAPPDSVTQVDRIDGFFRKGEEGTRDDEGQNALKKC